MKIPKYKRKVTCQGPATKLRVDFLTASLKANLHWNKFFQMLRENIFNLLLYTKDNCLSQIRIK